MSSPSYSINLLEKDIEDILEKHHRYFIEKGLELRGRQYNLHGKRVDLLFTDRFQDTLIVEIKKGTITRKHVAQILDYLGEVSLQLTDRIRLMLIGDHVPANWKIALDRQGVEYREITNRDLIEYLKINDQAYLDALRKTQSEKEYPSGNIDSPEKKKPDPTNIWKKIHNYAIEVLDNPVKLLNPNGKSSFIITEVSERYLKINKLPIKLKIELFQSVYRRIEKQQEWIRIGASRINTKTDTLEGYIKTNFFEGNMNGLSTAPWIAAILVNSLDNIEFNNKSRGQAIRFITRTPQSAQSPRPETQYPWSKVLTEVGTRFSTQYPNLKRMSKLPSSGSNVKILTNQSHVHFEWYIKGPVSLKTFEVGLHIEKRNQELNQKILSTLMAHKNEFTKIIGENVFFGPYGTTGKPRNVATKICVTKKFSRINEELIDWAVQSMSKFYNYFNPILNETPL